MSFAVLLPYKTNLILAAVYSHVYLISWSAWTAMDKFLSFCELLFIRISFTFTSSELPPKAIGYAFSSYALRQLVIQEQRVIPLLSNYLDDAQQKLRAIRWYEKNSCVSHKQTEFSSLGNILNDVGHLNETITPNAELDVLRHAQSFALIRKLAQDLDFTLDLLNEKAEINFIRSSNYLQNQIPYPNVKDLKDSMMSVLRLKETYNLAANDLAKGLLDDLETNSGLSKENIYELGSFSISGEMFTTALEFFEESLNIKRIKNNNTIGQKFVRTVEKSMTAAIEQHDKKLRNNEFIRNGNPFHFQDFIHNIRDAAFSSKIPVSKENFSKKAFPVDIVNAHIMFDKLCKRKDIRTHIKTKNLFCEFFSTHPYFFIQPFKFEWLSVDPKVLQIHHFLSINETNLLRSHAEPFLQISGVLKSEHNGIDDVRTSSTVTIDDMEKSSPFKFFSRRVKLLTGFNVDYASAELLQVTNYGPGGFYGPHFDAFGDGQGHSEKFDAPTVNEFFMGKGDRIATFMTYLSNVELGGGTAFPLLNFAAQPVQGSAIFWYNLKSDGTLNPLSLHGGCPILYGSKFIANKWIRSDGQMFVTACSKNRSSD